MPPRRNTNIESLTDEYIDSAVKVHVKASDVPPRENLNISFADADKLGDEVTLSNQEAYEESHGKLYDMTHNNTVPWRNWAFYIILLSMLTVCFTFAKYASFASGDAQAAVAKFDIAVAGDAAGATNVTIVDPVGNNSGTVNITFNEDNDGPQTITFRVTNNSDVTTHITSVECKLTSDSGNHTVTPTYDTGNIPSVDNVNNYKDFTLTITKSDTSATASGTLTIKVEQVD